MDLEDQLNEFYNHVVDKMSFNPDQKAKITGAGAEAYAKVLEKNTPKSSIDYSNKSVDVGRSGKKVRHLREDIKYKAGYVDENVETGDTDVGFNSKDDFLISIINDGKKKMSSKEQANLHFIDRSQADARDDIAKAMSDKLDEVLQDDH